MKMDDYYRQVEELPVIDPLTAYDEVQCYSGLFDMQQVMCRITTKADIHERQLHRRGMYPICDSPVPTSSGFIPHRPSPTFKPIDPAAPTPASGKVSTSQGSSQQNSPSTDRSLPCGQHTPQGISITSSQRYITEVHKIIFKVPPTVMSHHHSKLLHLANSFPCLHAVHPHRMLHHCNLLHQHLNHFSSLQLCTRNSSCCYSHQLLHCMLHTSSKVSHYSYNLGLALKANILGNKGIHSPLCKISIILCSLSFQLWRHNKIQCSTPRNLEFPSQQMAWEQKAAPQQTRCVSDANNQDT